MSTKGREALGERASGSSVARHTNLRVVKEDTSRRGPTVAGVAGGAR